MALAADEAGHVKVYGDSFQDVASGCQLSEM